MPSEGSTVYVSGLNSGVLLSAATRPMARDRDSEYTKMTIIAPNNSKLISNTVRTLSHRHRGVRTTHASTIPSGERAYFKRRAPNTPNICICGKEISAQNAMIRHCSSHDRKTVVPNYRGPRSRRVTIITRVLL
jgi:hypothetical protein